MDPNEAPRQDPMSILAAKMVVAMTTLNTTLEGCTRGAGLTQELVNERLGPTIACLVKEFAQHRKLLKAHGAVVAELVDALDTMTDYMQTVDKAFNLLSDARNVEPKRITFTDFIDAYAEATDQLEKEEADAPEEEATEAVGADDDDEDEEDGD